MGEDAFGHDFRGAEGIAAVDEVDGGGEACEVEGFFAGGVAAAYDDEGFIAEHGEGTVAGGAVGDAFVFEKVFAWDAEVAVAGSGGDDDGLGFDAVAVDGDGEGTVGEVDLFDGGERADAGSEAFRLLLHVGHELESVDTVDEARVVFDDGGRGEEAALHAAGDDEWVEVGAGGVEGGGEAGAAGADDDDVFHGGGSMGKREAACKIGLRQEVVELPQA